MRSREVGRVDLLANVAGTGSTQNVVETPPELWDAVFAVNVRGIFNTARAVLPGMIERGGGVIVNAASIAGMVGLRDRAAYCASKGAVIALTKAMAIDHVGDGIRVNCVCPGTVDTPWVGRLIDAADDPVATRAALVARQPIGRLGTRRGGREGDRLPRLRRRRLRHRHRAGDRRRARRRAEA